MLSSSPRRFFLLGNIFLVGTATWTGSGSSFVTVDAFAPLPTTTTTTTVPLASAATAPLRWCATTSVFVRRPLPLSSSYSLTPLLDRRGYRPKHYNFLGSQRYMVGGGSKDENEAAKDNTDENEEIIADDGQEVVIRRPKIDALIEDISFRMRRLAWLSWWAQVILTVVASVTLLFTRNVMDLQATGGSTAAMMTLPNYFLAGSGIVLSFVSIFWTWATRRLSRRLLRKPTTKIQAAGMIRKDVSFGVGLNLLGAAAALLGLEQVIGGLAIKVLTTTATSSNAVLYGSGSAAALLQPLDILVVQANANLMFSHFCSLVANLVMGRSILRLDPPSTEEDPRKGRR